MIVTTIMDSSLSTYLNIKYSLIIFKTSKRAMQKITKANREVGLPSIYAYKTNMLMLMMMLITLQSPIHL